MNAVTRLTPPAVSAYAPGAASTHVSEVTVAAVDKIGTATSDQIRHTAESMETDAKKIADKLRELADAFDEQTRIASEKVSAFCMKMNQARSIVRSLEGEIKEKIANQAQDDGESSPAFLHTRTQEG